MHAPTKPDGGDCIAIQGVGESERAMLEYLTGMVPRRIASGSAATCGLRLIQDRAADGDTGADSGWRLIWQGGRLGYANERHRLFIRDAQANR